MDAVQHSATVLFSPIDVDGVLYYPAVQVSRVLGISRQTLWRWRQEGKVPAGRRYRDQQVLFTASELEEIIEHSNRLEPLAVPSRDQLNLPLGRKDSSH